MNLNFGNTYYSGDPFWVSILLSFIGAFFGFGFALIIYYRTLQNDNKKETLKKNKEYADTLLYFQNLIDGSVSHTKNLFESLTSFINKQKIDLLDIQTIKYRVNNDIKRLNNQDSQSIFLAYRHFMSGQKDWIQDYQRIYNSIDL